MIAFGLDVRIGPACATEVRLNDIPLAAKPVGQAASQSLAMQQDVLPGRNDVVLMVGAPREATGRLPDPLPSGAYVEMRLEMDTVTRVADGWQVATQQLDKRIWRPEEMDAGERAQLQMPHRLAIAFDAPSTLAAPVWAAAAPVSADSVRPGVIAALSDLHRLLSARDVDGFTAIMAARYQDMARAFPQAGAPLQRRERDGRMIAEMLAEPGFLVAPFDPAQVVCAAYAGGRVIECKGRDGQPVLRGGTPGDDPTYFSVAFSLLGGRLTVTR